MPGAVMPAMVGEGPCPRCGSAAFTGDSNIPDSARSSAFADCPETQSCRGSPTGTVSRSSSHKARSGICLPTTALLSGGGSGGSGSCPKLSAAASRSVETGGSGAGLDSDLHCCKLGPGDTASVSEALGSGCRSESQISGPGMSPADQVLEARGDGGIQFGRNLGSLRPLSMSLHGLDCMLFTTTSARSIESSNASHSSRPGGGSLRSFVLMEPAGAVKEFVRHLTPTGLRAASICKTSGCSWDEPAILRLLQGESRSAWGDCATLLFHDRWGISNAGCTGSSEGFLGDKSSVPSGAGGSDSSNASHEPACPGPSTASCCCIIARSRISMKVDMPSSARSAPFRLGSASNTGAAAAAAAPSVGTWAAALRAADTSAADAGVLYTSRFSFLPLPAI